MTHDVFQAKRLAHRTGLMIGGRIVELADTEAFFSAPQQPETAAFLRGELVGGAAPPEREPGRGDRRWWRRLRTRAAWVPHLAPGWAASAPSARSNESSPTWRRHPV